MESSVLRRLIWPENKTLFLAGGAALGLLADVMSFLGNLGSPAVLIWPALVIGGLLGWLCWPRLKTVDGQDGAECPECGAFRLSLYAIVAMGLLIAVGQGASATERLGQQLGLIQQDVTAIRTDVSAIRDVTASGELIPNPRTAAERFNNAWIYATLRRENEGAWRELQALYAAGGVGKMDAADLYFRTGLAFLPREQLVAQMVEIGRSKRDAAMLVVAARTMSSAAETAPLMAEARTLDPDLAFAYWDQGVSVVDRESGSARDRHEQGLARVAALEAFLEAARRRRPAQSFFLPQYQPDWEALVEGDLQHARDRLPRLAERAAREEQRGR
ncbi:MAG: hypothetical protein JNK94_02640 [Hyphomonadaceae bacterium]|nr:hypothetical protein [Hyphomonadaceae bacterium]MBX3510245.1 hypothetical protein [Hyphomonadaceae bacterium]